VKITQQIAPRDYTWSADVRGTSSISTEEDRQLVRASKNDKLWLDRPAAPQGRRRDDAAHPRRLLRAVEVEPVTAAPDETGKKNESDLPV
jgi:hypothetical protein